MSTPAITYHTDGAGNIWKFEEGQPPMHRYDDEAEWDESAFDSYEEFLAGRDDTMEIEEGEPV